MSKKVFVFCPGGVVTGGPELLHQFTHELRNAGVDAQMIYYPIGKEYSVPERYQHYDVKISRFDRAQIKDQIVVVPEVVTVFLNSLPRCSAFIWWLSVDNYFFGEIDNPTKRVSSILKGGKLSVYAMKKYKHLVQSEYARLFLLKHEIESEMLTDYLNEKHLTPVSENIQRHNIIAFNPAKGIEVTKYLIENNPDFKFIPIANMTPEQVKNLLLQSKVYIDFGSHPGKDRFPREAAMAGCCIVTGIKGSARNHVDIPIPDSYKLDSDSDEFLSKFRMLILSIFNDFAIMIKDFDGYKKIICDEPTHFKNQVRDFVGKYCS
ncbi:hypothetical protein [Musicola keenii]|uniref:hypothetical protein n=1 Tax=Musicola keenii TaxID=2884250 RepID=UPI00178681ED|nr:hypothetical protein [Musicola keenii]